MTKFFLTGEIPQTVVADTSGDTWVLTTDALLQPEAASGFVAPDGVDDQNFDIRGVIDADQSGISLGVGDAALGSSRIRIFGTGEVRAEGSAISFARDDLFIVNNGLIAGNIGVDAKADGWRLLNRGSIEGQEFGILAFGAEFVVRNLGDVRGDIGLHAFGANGNIRNIGEIVGETGAAIAIGDDTPGDVSGIRLSNSGLIQGETEGVHIGPNADDTRVFNNGALMATEGAAIDASASVEGSSLVIFNRVNGFIQGGRDAEGEFSAAISTGDGAETVRNTGRIDGEIDLGAGADLYVARGEGLVTGAVNGGDGDDRLIGGLFEDALHGDGGDDFINGADGDDRLFGGDNEDVLFDGAGSDQMAGGADRDRFVYQGKDAEGVDIILDFEIGIDVLDLRRSSLTGQEDAEAHIADDINGNAELTMDNGAVLRVIGVSTEDLVDDIIV